MHFCLLFFSNQIFIIYHTSLFLICCRRLRKTINNPNVNQVTFFPIFSEVKIRVIEYDASGFKGPENTRHQEYVVAEIITHPKYDPVRLSHDLAVLKVETKKDRFGDITGKIDLLHSDDVNAACIPGCANQFDYQFSNGTGVRYVNISIIQK